MRRQFFEKGSSVSQFLSDLETITEFTTAVGQRVQLFCHSELGKVLIINNEIQNIEAWAPIYHESVVHISCAFVKKIKRALILGGGSLFAASELLKYDSLEEVVMIDFDKEIINLVVDNYNHAKEALGDKRLRLIHQDFLSGIESEGLFDVVINDAIDLFNHETMSLTGNLFEKIILSLTEFGVCGDLIYRHIFERKTTISTIKILTEKFRPVFSLVHVPEYPGVLHLLSLWGTNAELNQGNTTVLNDEQLLWLTGVKVNPCVWYNPKYLAFYMYLPPYIRNLFPLLKNKIPLKA